MTTMRPRPRRRRPPAWRWSALLCASAGLSAAASDPFDLAAWDETQLRPDANLVYLNDRLVLHPKARLTGGFDTNSSQTAKAQENAFIGVAGGAELWIMAVEDQRLQLEALSESPIDDYNGLRSWPWLLRARWELHGDGTGHTAQFLSRRQDSPPLVQTGRQVDRVENEGSYSGWLAGERLGVGLSANWTGVHFLEAAPEFALTERDSDLVRVGIDGNWQRAEISQIELGLSLGELRYRRTTPYQDGRFARVGAAWKLPLGDRTWVRLAGGATAWRFAAPWNDDANRDDRRVLAGEGGLELRWDHAEGSFLTAHANASSLPGVMANEDRVYDAGVFGRLAVLQSWGVDAELGGTRVEASSGDAATGPERRTGWRAGTGVELYLVTGWLIRLAVNYTDSRAAIAEPFTRTIVMGQATVIW